MNAIKKFDEFIKMRIVKKQIRDISRAEFLIKEAERKMLSLKERVEKLSIKNENANDYVEYCYDIIMHLVRAKLYLSGYCASGQGAHEAEVSYLTVLGFDEKEVLFVDQMRYFRNGILYYGTSLDAEYAEKAIEFTNKIYPKLRSIF